MVLNKIISSLIFCLTFITVSTAKPASDHPAAMPGGDGIREERIARLESQGDAYFMDLEYELAAACYENAMELTGGSTLNFERYEALLIKYLLNKIEIQTELATFLAHGPDLTALMETVEQGMLRAESHYGPGSARNADFLHLKGMCQYCAGDIRGAVETFEECVRLQEGMHDRIEERWSARLILATIMMENGDAARAVDGLLEIVELVPFNSDPITEPTIKEEIYFNSRIVLSVGYNALSGPREGLELLESVLDEALEFAERGKHEANTTCSLLSFAASMATHIYGSSIAQEYSDKMLDISSRILGDTNMQYFRALDVKASLCFLQGELSMAANIYHTALEGRIKKYGRVSTLVADSHSNLCKVYMYLQDYELAEKHIRAALDITQEMLGNDHPTYAVYMWQLGQLKRMDGDTDGADNIQYASLTTLEETIGTDYALYRQHVDQTILDSTDADEDSIRKLEELLEEWGDEERLSWKYASALFELGYIHFMLDNLDSALIRFRECLEVMDDANIVGTQLNVLCTYGYGAMLDALGYLVPAEQMYRRCFQALLTVMEWNFVLMPESNREFYWGDYSSVVKDIQDFALSYTAQRPALAALAYDCELFSKNLLMDASRKLLATIMDGGDEEMAYYFDLFLEAGRELEKERGKGRNINTHVGGISYLADRTDSLEQYRRDLERRMVARAEANHGLKLDAARWTDVRDALSDGQAAVEYVACPDRLNDNRVRYWALVIRPGREYPDVIPLGLERHVLAAVRGDGGADDATGISTRGILEWLWNPLLPYIDGCNEFFISLSGALNTVPLDAAVTYTAISGGREPVAIHNVMSTGYLAESPGPVTRNDHAVFIGGLDYWEYDGYGSGRRQGPEAHEEAFAGNTGPEGTQIDDSDRTEAALRAEGPQGSVRTEVFRIPDVAVESEIPDNSGIEERNSKTVISEPGALDTVLPSRYRGQGYDFLPWSLREVTVCAARLAQSGWRTDVLTDTEGTKNRLLDYTGTASPRILHISTHGFYFPQASAVGRSDTAGNAAEENGAAGNGAANTHTTGNGTDMDTGTGAASTSGLVPTMFERNHQYADDPLMRAGLLLSGANVHVARQEPGGNSDYQSHPTALPDVSTNGILSAAEITTLWFGGTELVVLSACDTGIGDTDHSEGVYGLQRAFRIAGVPNMILTLNRVPDRESCEFMTYFYTVLSGGATIRDSFTAAQTEMMLRYRDAPGIWGAFKLIE